jgi:hypothetical protein
MTSTQKAERTLEFPHGDLRLLETDPAQRLLHAPIPARLDSSGLMESHGWFPPGSTGPAEKL